MQEPARNKEAGLRIFSYLDYKLPALKKGIKEDFIFVSDPKNLTGMDD